MKTQDIHTHGDFHPSMMSKKKQIKAYIEDNCNRANWLSVWKEYRKYFIRVLNSKKLGIYDERVKALKEKWLNVIEWMDNNLVC